MLETFKEKKSANVVIDTTTIKKKRILVSNDYNAKSFISVDFCQENDKLLVTLGDDARIVVWLYDKQKCVASELIVIQSHTSILRQVSFSNVNPNFILVTGKDVYKYYHLTETNQLKIQHSNFARKDDNSNPAISTNFVCHSWLADGRFILCTDIGQILQFEANGDYKGL